MKIRLHFIILSALLLFSMPLEAQNDYARQIYDQALDEYQLGRIEEARELLKENLKGFNESMKKNCYRLLSICSLALDEDEEAQKYAAMLLSEDPYFSPSLDDPMRFIDMVNDIKAGMTHTITTASNQEESLNEVPVPTTLITEEMIRNSGARNLQEVLAAFVPGINIVDCNDDINIAMRGLYSNGQENILIMLNGHRLNSYCTNIAAPDFSISLEKLKQIEVLRGPASSLYGGVALTAVVNLITKQGADVDGVMLKGGIGNYGQMQGDLIFGKRYFDLDLLVWGSIYKAKGQKFSYFTQNLMYMRYFEGKYENITVGEIGNKPSYDFGFQMKWKDLLFMYNTQYSQITAPFSMGHLHTPYNVDGYRTFNGIKPSYATQAHHADLSYGHQFGKLGLRGSIRYDNGDLTHYQVISDSVLSSFSSIIGIDVNPTIKKLDSVPGLSRYINGLEQTIGAQINGEIEYLKNKSHIGTLAFGAEYIHYQMSDARYVLGYNFNEIIEPAYISDYGKGKENSFSTFLQLKHKWRSFILNAGLRYDYKVRFDESTINELSPRLALIYIRPKWNLRLSYSKSFIDAPYLYRKSNIQINAFRNKEFHDPISLTKETLHSYQLSFGGNQWVNGLNFEFNLYYNRAFDLICQGIIEHENAGDMDSYGLEFQGNYVHKNFSLNLTSSWQKVRKSTLFGRSYDDSFNIPYFTSNLVVGWRPHKNFLLHSHMLLEGKSTYYEIDVTTKAILNYAYNQFVYYSKIGDIENMERLYSIITILEDDDKLTTKEIPLRFIMNVGAEYTYRNVTIGLNINNLFNKYYERSGMGTGTVPQKGRWIMANISYRF